MKKRLMYILITIIVFLMGVVLIKWFDNGGFIRGFLGDLIVVIFMYCLIKIFFDIEAKKLIIGVLLFSFTIEILQYFKLINYLGLQEYKLAQILLGATFDTIDLIAYTIGGVVVYFMDTKLIIDKSY